MKYSGASRARASQSRSMRERTSLLPGFSGGPLRPGTQAPLRGGRNQLSNSTELGYGLFDGAEFFDEGHHAVLGVIKLLGAFQDVGGVLAGDDGDAIVIGNDDVVGVDANTGAGDGNVGACEAVMVDGSGWRDAHSEYRELEAADLRRIANGGVDDGAGEAADFHGGSHQPSDAGGIGAVLEHHDVHRSRGGGVDGVEHALGSGGAIVMLFLLQENSDGGAGKPAHE